MQSAGAGGPSLLDSALGYARRGWKVVPCHTPDPVAGGCSCTAGGEPCKAKSAGKHPRTPNGLKDATTDEDKIRFWWQVWPDANIALIAPLGVFILDVDQAGGHASGASGVEALAALEGEHGDLPSTPAAITGGGGRHLFFALPEGVTHSTGRGALPLGLDVRSCEKGYVVAAPSLHSSGNRYAWKPFASPDHLQLAPIPDWLLALAKKGSTVADGKAFAPEDLPTEVPARLRRVAAAAGLKLRPVKNADGGIRVLELSQCPACGKTDHHCKLMPISGRLFSFHANTCPAGAKATGKRPDSEAGLGIPLEEWVATFAPQALGALQAKAPETGYKRPEEERVAKAIDELAALQWSAQETSLGAWMNAAGLHEDVAEALFWEAALVVADDEIAGAKLSRLAGAIAAQRRPDGGVLVRVRDGVGAVRNAAWLDGGGCRLLGRKLAGTPADYADGLAVLGDVPAAVAGAAAGRPVVIASSPLDWLTARGLVLMDALDAEVLAPCKPEHVETLAKVLAGKWSEAGALPPRIVFVVRGGDDQGPIRRAAKLLDGRAGVAICEPTTPGGTGGLLESLAEFGPASVARSILTAPWSYEPPIDIAEAGAQIVKDLEKAVKRACFTTTSHARIPLVVYQIDPAAGKSRHALSVAARIADGRFLVPNRARRPKGWPEDQWPPTERRIGFALQSHLLAEEKHADFGKFEPLGTRRLLKGALAYCAYKKQVDDVYPSVGRRGICGDADDPDQRCTEADKGCLGAVQPTAERGAVNFMAHAMAPNLPMDFCFIDESPGVFDVDTVGRDTIATLFASKLHSRVKAWRTVSNPEAGAAAQRLADLVQPLANAHGAEITSGKADPYPKWLTGEELAKLLDDEVLRVNLENGYYPKAAKPPVPFPAEARAGVHAGRHMPSRLAFQALQSLRGWYRRFRKLDEDELVVLDQGPKPPQPMAAVRLEPDGTWSLEVYQVAALPDCPVVMLDATGETTIDEYKAAYPDRDVVIIRRRVQGTSPLIALHLTTKMLRRRRIFGDSGLNEHAPARFRAAYLRAVNELIIGCGPLDRPYRLGALQFMLVHGLMTEPGTASSPAEKRMASIAAELRMRGAELRSGYFGKHDRGTNAFEDVDGLIVLGDPLPNLGAVGVQCAFLGLEAKKVARDRAAATLVQAVFRARHTRRTKDRRAVLIYVGEHAPDIAGVQWTVEALADSHAPRGQQSLASAVVRWVAAENGEVVGVRLIRATEFRCSKFEPKAVAELSDRVLDRACRTYAKERGLVPYDVLTPGTTRASGTDIITIFGTSPSSVRAVAHSLCWRLKNDPVIPNGDQGGIIGEIRENDPKNDPKNDENDMGGNVGGSNLLNDSALVPVGVYIYREGGGERLEFELEPWPDPGLDRGSS